MAARKKAIDYAALDLGVPAAQAAPEPITVDDPPAPAALKKLTVFLEKAAWRQLNGLADEREISGQRLLEEAIDDLFRKYGRPPIAGSGVANARKAVVDQKRRSSLAEEQ